MKLIETHVITADDWGMSPGVNRGILRLAQKGYVRRVGIMSTVPFFKTDLEELKQVPGIELGLHFNLSEGEDAVSTPARLLMDWLFGRLDKEKITQIFSKQMSCLTESGVNPVFFNSHQHVHLVPGVMNAVADLLKAEKIFDVRMMYDAALWSTLKFPINIVAMIFYPTFRKHGFFSKQVYYPTHSDMKDIDYFSRMLIKHRSKEVLVHPALENDFEAVHCTDPYREGRLLEMFSIEGAMELVERRFRQEKEQHKLTPYNIKSEK